MSYRRHPSESFHPLDFGEDLIIEDEFYIEDEIIVSDDDDDQKKEIKDKEKTKDIPKASKNSTKKQDQQKSEIPGKDKIESKNDKSQSTSETKSKSESKKKDGKTAETKLSQDNKKVDIKPKEDTKSSSKLHSGSKATDKEVKPNAHSKDADKNLKNESKPKPEADKLLKSDPKIKGGIDKSYKSDSKSKSQHTKNNLNDLEEWYVNDEIVEMDGSDEFKVADEARDESPAKAPLVYKKNDTDQIFFTKLRNIPLIGLEYGVEVKEKSKPSIFHCLLCEIDFLAEGQVSNHFASVTHRLKYIEKHFSLVRKVFPRSQPQKWDLRAMILFAQVCQKIEETFGRKSMLISGPNYQRDVNKAIADKYDCHSDKDKVILNFANESLNTLRAFPFKTIDRMWQELGTAPASATNKNQAVPKDKIPGTKSGLKSAFKDTEDISSVEEEEIFTPLALKDAEHICSGEEELFDKEVKKKDSNNLKTNSSSSLTSKKESSIKPLKVCKHKKPIETGHSKTTGVTKSFDNLKRPLKESSASKELPPNKKSKDDKEYNQTSYPRRPEMHSKEKNESAPVEQHGAALKDRPYKEHLHQSPKDHHRRSTSRGYRGRSGSMNRLERNSSKERIHRGESREKNTKGFSKEGPQRNLSRDRYHRNLSRDRGRRSLSRGRHRRSLSRGRYPHSRERTLSKDRYADPLRDRHPLTSDKLIVREIDLPRERPARERSPSFTRRIRMRSRSRERRSRSRDRRSLSRSRGRSRSRSRERSHKFFIRKLGIISSGDIKRHPSPGPAMDRRHFEKENRGPKDGERLKRFSKTPEKEVTSPKITYEEEWAKFYVRRWNQLQKAGKDPEKYDYEKEWSVYWGQLLKKMTETAISSSIKKDKKEKHYDKETASNINSKYKTMENIKVLKVIEPEVSRGRPLQNPSSSRIFDKYPSQRDSSKQTSSQSLEPSLWDKYKNTSALSSTKPSSNPPTSSTTSLWNKQQPPILDNKDKSFWRHEPSVTEENKPSTTDTVLNALNSSLKDAPPSYRNEMVFKILSAINEDPTSKISSQKSTLQFPFSHSDTDQRMRHNQPNASTFSSQAPVTEIATKLATILKSLGLENLPESKLLEIINYIRGSGGHVSIEEIAKAHFFPEEESSSHRPSFGTSLKDLPSLKDIPSFKEMPSFRDASSFKDMPSFKNIPSLRNMPSFEDIPSSNPNYSSSYPSDSWQPKKQAPLPPQPPVMPPFRYPPPHTPQIDSFLSKPPPQIDTFIPRPPDITRKPLGPYESEFSGGRTSHAEFSSSLEHPRSFSSSSRFPSGPNLSFDDTLRRNFPEPSGPRTGIQLPPPPPPTYSSTFPSQEGFSSLSSGSRAERPPLGNFQTASPSQSWLDSQSYRPPHHMAQYNKPTSGPYCYK